MISNMEYDYQGLTNEIVARGFNLADSEEGWWKFCKAYSSLGEAGRQMFHDVAALSSKYIQAENDKKFDHALHIQHGTTMASVIYEAQQAGIDTNRFFLKNENKTERIVPQAKKVVPPSEDKPMYVVPRRYTEGRYLSIYNTFTQALLNIGFRCAEVDKAISLYRLGTYDSKVIFWQIDELGRYRTGKVMNYDILLHRIKKTTESVDWMHRIITNKPASQLGVQQCLFGQHLLKSTQNTIAIVEAEKTAVVCSMLMPEFTWMAVGSLNEFKPNKLECLKDRDVIAFPDTDPDGMFYKKWKETAGKLDFPIRISDYLERNATDEEKEKKIDIADLFLRDLGRPHILTPQEESERIKRG